MIVECSNCDTRFQLDDSRVPLRGIRVRCSRCKEAFFLEHPDASKGDALNDVAAQAATGVAPDTTQDLPPGTSLVDSASPAEAEEEDWQFSEDLPGGDPNEASSSDLLDPELDPFGTGVGDESDELASEDAAVGEDRVMPGLGLDMGSSDGAEDVGSGLDLASDDDDSNLSGDAGMAPEGEALAVEGVAEVDAGSDFGEATDFSALAEEPEEPAGTEVEAALPSSQEDVGEPEDWDFFSDESLEQPGLGSMDNAMGRAMQAVEDPSRLTARSGGPDLGSVRSGSGSRLRPLRSAGRALGWIATLCLFGVGIARGVFDVASPAAQPTTSVDFGVFEAHQVRGSWLETARTTRLYAVTGQLVNGSLEARAPGTGLQVSLLSPEGVRLEIPAASAGLPMTEAQLRELPSAELARAARQATAELAALRVEPGQTVAFQAFFDGIPDDATGFSIEMDQIPPPLPPVLPEWLRSEGLEPGSAEISQAPVAGETVEGETADEGSLRAAPSNGVAPTTPSSDARAPAAPQPPRP